MFRFRASLSCGTRICFASSLEMTVVGGHHAICFVKHRRLGREKLGAVERDQIVANGSRFQTVQICSFSDRASLAQVVRLNVGRQAVLVGDVRRAFDERLQVIVSFLGDTTVLGQDPLGGEVLHEIRDFLGRDGEVLDVVLLAIAALECDHVTSEALVGRVHVGGKAEAVRFSAVDEGLLGGVAALGGGEVLNLAARCDSRIIASSAFPAPPSTA